MVIDSACSHNFFDKFIFNVKRIRKHGHALNIVHNETQHFPLHKIDIQHFHCTMQEYKIWYHDVRTITVLNITSHERE